MAHPNINITKKPTDEVVSAYNCIEYCFQITDYITVVGSESFLDIQVDAAIPANETMTIFGQQFLFTADVNDNGHNIALGADEFEQRDFIYDTLLTCYEIVKNFIVAKVGTDRISLTAKNKGAYYDSGFTSSDSNLQEITNTAGIDTEVHKQYKIIGCIQVIENGEWVTKEELLRDVSFVSDGLGGFEAEVCFKLHGILRNLYSKEKPDLLASAPFIDINGSFQFKFGFVDFKSITGQVAVSGFFDVGDSDIITVINGMHKLQDNDLRMMPYYQNLPNGYLLPLNQIPNILELCCDNNGFLSVFIHDKDNEGWSIEVIGNIYFSSGSIEFDNKFAGFAGVGSAVVVIPIGPMQIGICDNYLDGGNVDSYNYQAYVFNNSAAANLFLDGDNGTFQLNISNMIQLAGLTMAQTANGYVGNGLLLSDIEGGSYVTTGTTILTHTTGINFELGNVYFIEAWIKVNGLDCNCIANMFLDAIYGTFDGVDPLNDITVIASASSDIINGFEDDSLKIYDLQLTSLASLGYLMSGDSPIGLINNHVYKIKAWVKIIGVDCQDCLFKENLFVDGDYGTFEGGTPLAGIVALAGITTGIGGGNPGDGLELTTLDAATIVDGSVLFRGDTNINFQAGETYTLKMYARVEGFDCLSLPYLFVDGDYGTFEADIIGMTAPVTNTIISQIAAGRLGGNSLLLENALPLSLGVNSVLIKGDTAIDFIAGKDYELVCWIDLEGDALTTACADVTGLTLGIRIADILSVGDITVISNTDAIYNSSTCGSNPTWIEMKYKFTANNTISKIVGVRIIAGPSFLEPALQEIYFDDITVEDINAIPEIKLNAGLITPIGANGTETTITSLLLEPLCSDLDTWVLLETTIDVTNSFVGKVGLLTTGLSHLLANPSVIVRSDIITVEGEFESTLLRMSSDNLPVGSSIVYDNEIALGIDCSQLEQWIQLETTVTTGVFTGNINIGLQVYGNASCLTVEDVEVMIDNIEVISVKDQNLEFFISTSDDADILSSLKIDCSKLDQWHKIVSSYTPTADTTETVTIRVKNRTECITSGEISIDEIKVFCRDDISASLTPLQTINMKNTSEDCCCEDCCNEEFAYLNELGQWDFIHFECMKEGTLNASTNEVDVCVGCDEDISTQGSRAISARSKDRFIINARIPIEKREQFKIFAASIEKYHIVDKKYYPIRLITTELPIFRLTNTFVDVDLEFEYKFENPTLIA